MMKTKLLAPLMLAAALCACQTLPASPAAASPAPAAASAPSTDPTVSAKIGAALDTVTAARKTLTAAAQAGSISWATDDQVQAALTLIRTHLTTAQSLVPTSPAQAAQLLSEALTDLANLQGASK